MTLLLNNSSLLGYIPFQVLIDLDPIVDLHRLMGHRLEIMLSTSTKQLKKVRELIDLVVRESYSLVDVDMISRRCCSLEMIRIFSILRVGYFTHQVKFKQWIRVG